ncbi:hypothetical protein BDZ97DRAFT_424033 [Flammula alnicola]|nr:hypothetical protein BDZ97DRAFT_424033 [Flammula alnicola]
MRTIPSCFSTELELDYEYILRRSSRPQCKLGTTLGPYLYGLDRVNASYLGHVRIKGGSISIITIYYTIGSGSRGISVCSDWLQLTACIIQMSVNRPENYKISGTERAQLTYIIYCTGDRQQWRLCSFLHPRIFNIEIRIFKAKLISILVDEGSIWSTWSKSGRCVTA